MLRGWDVKISKVIGPALSSRAGSEERAEVELEQGRGPANSGEADTAASRCGMRHAGGRAAGRGDRRRGRGVGRQVERGIKGEGMGER